MENVPSSCLLMVSPLALKYKASRRIKNLSIPKGWCKWYCPPHLYHLDAPKEHIPCPCERISHVHKLATPKMFKVQPKDYRHVKYLDVYHLGKEHSCSDM